MFVLVYNFDSAIVLDNYQYGGDVHLPAARILSGDATLDEVGDGMVDLVKDMDNGTKNKSGELGQTEFILTYKTFEPIGPACLPL